MPSRDHIVLIGWFAANMAGIALLAFGDALALHVVGWLWTSAALWLSGLAVVGGLSGFKGAKEEVRDA